MLIIALTGGIASGKTTVSEAFSRLGVPIIDTDVIAREVVAPGSPGFERVVAAFGHSILSGGEIDRARLRERIFSDPEQRRRLEAILHPLIESETRRRIRGLSDAPYAIIVVPLLLESDLRNDAHRVLVVDADEAIQFDRLRRRDGVDEDLARRMMASQTGRAQRLEIADDVIDNNEDLPSLLRQVRKLHATYLTPNDSL